MSANSLFSLILDNAIDIYFDFGKGKIAEYFCFV